MAQPAGRRLPLSRARRFIGDLMRQAARVPTVSIERRMQLAPVVAARQAAGPRPSWCALFTKAYAFVAAARPELRRVYMSFPWPHLYEHPINVASVAVERHLDDEDAVFFGHLRTPEKQGLMDLDEALRRLKEEPVASIPLYRRIRKVSGLPWPLRRLAWWWGLNSSGHRRVRLLGTFGVNVVAGLGAGTLYLPSPLTTTLSYGAIAEDGSVDVRLLFDHRVVDGATIARALEDLERVLKCEILAELRYFEALAA
jgi:hypothetical protein